jgi:DNA-binding NarL/FixJ family response regulator
MYQRFSPRVTKLLTPRQADVARCVARGLMDKEIARELRIAYPSVKSHMGRIRHALNVNSRTQIAVFVITGWLPDEH